MNADCTGTHLLGRGLACLVLWLLVAPKASGQTSPSGGSHSADGNEALGTYTVEYSYDAAGRLTQALYDESFAVAYRYDAAGNVVAIAAGPSEPVRVGGGEGMEAFALHPSYPNPFNLEATIPFDVKAPVRVRVEVYDVLGRRVAIVVDREYTPGRHSARFDAGGGALRHLLLPH